MGSISSDDSALLRLYTAKPAHMDVNGSQNYAFVLQEKGRFAYEARDVPALSSDQHVLIAIKATGLCGSDIHYWQHGEIGNFKVRNPLILGHESAGIVMRCGTAVTSLGPGDAVAIEPGIPCRVCQYCKSGKYNLCPDVHFAATPPHDGTLQTHVAIPSDFCYKLPTHVSLEEGALLEPLSVAVHGVKLAQVSLGTSVLVLGAGPIGALCCATARAFGAAKITAVDIVPERLAFIRQYAAVEVYQMEKLCGPAENAAGILSTHRGFVEGFDVVIEATGAEACITTGVHALKRGGVFVQAGLGSAEVKFPMAQLCSKEASFLGSFRYGAGDYDQALNLVETGLVDLKPLITHRYRFEEAEEAFKNVAQRQGIKSIIYGPGEPWQRA